MKQNRYCLSITKVLVSASDVGNENRKILVSAPKNLVSPSLVRLALT